MGGSGAHDGQSGGEVHTVFAEQLERNHALVVVHGQHGIEFGVSTGGEETVCGERSEGVDTIMESLIHSRLHDFLILIT